MKGGHYTLNMS